MIGSWYEEHRSGATLARAELARLRADVAAGRLRKVYVYRLDRLTRSGIQDTLRLLSELRGGGCVVESIADGLPPMSGPFAEFFAAILAWFSEFERTSIRERQLAARKRLEASGKGWGRPRRLTAEREDWFRRQVKAGRKLTELAEQTDVSVSTIQRMLRRDRKTGKFRR